MSQLVAYGSREKYAAVQMLWNCTTVRKTFKSPKILNK